MSPSQRGVTAQNLADFAQHGDVLPEAWHPRRVLHLPRGLHRAHELRLPAQVGPRLRKGPHTASTNKRNDSLHCRADRDDCAASAGARAGGVRAVSAFISKRGSTPIGSRSGIFCS